MTIASPALLDPGRSTPDISEQRARIRAIIAPRTGERGLDIGCGFGLLACELARDVGPTGRIMGVDAVPDMIIACEERARHDAVTGRTEFRQADPEAVPASSGSFDFVTAMQVYEYMADVERGLAEAYRVLKPGGRLAVSDVVVRGEVPAEIRRSVELWIGCLAGALEEREYRDKLAAAGFEGIDLEPTRVYHVEEARDFLTGAGLDVDAIAPQVADRFMSAFVRARKPA